MSGHAILDSCHNCGKKSVNLNVVSVSENSTSCQEFKESGESLYHHIHVFVACDECKKEIWDKD